MTIEAAAPQQDLPYRNELLSIIQADIDKHPRSAQTQIGPSEIGACPTQVAWKLAYGGASDRPGGWAAARGTRLHSWMDEIFRSTDRRMPDGSPRFLTDLKLDPVTDLINGGTLDVFDMLHRVCVDFKFPGTWSMDHVRNGDLNDTYRTQVQVYGLGLEAMGHPVSKVALLFMPSGTDDLWGTAKGAIYRWWPYDRAYAIDAIRYVQRIQDMIDVAGPRRVMEVLPKRSSFCSSCPAWAGSGDRRAICPGVATSRARKALDPSNPFAR